MNKKQTVEERLIDIINKWHKYESYPPIRPLVKKIVEELKANDNVWREKIRKFGYDQTVSLYFKENSKKEIVLSFNKEINDLFKGNK